MRDSGWPVIPCTECGKLFKPARPEIDRCRRCEGVSGQAVTEDTLPPVAIPFFDVDESPVKEPNPDNPCQRCGAPAPVGDRLCPVCREALRLSLSRAALEMSQKMFDQRRKRSKASLDIRPLLEEKEDRAARASISTEYLPVKRY
ncbi:MAG TPA: hypothetical protein PK349_00710 [Candidatus Hydrogenedentes bacterium]|nr:hypothetical protein [Candidatus Hydrogenedentota bacterium]